ncbi:MAG: hypothetical protein J5379_02885 [Clostridiales bacterium]|nr:hypothetical protein [Clostridiales bacterium]
MRRVITKEEKKILDRNSERICSTAIFGRQGFSFLALAIGMTIGCILGAIVGFGIIGMENEGPSMLAFFGISLSVAAITVYLTSVIGTKRIHDRYFVVGKTQINGATIILDEESGVTAYTEDDYLDENGNPYKIAVTDLFVRPQNETRYIIVINGDTTFMMSAEGELAGLIPKSSTEMPQSQTEIPQAKNEIIGHPNQFRITDDHVPEAQQRIKRFHSVYPNTNRYRKSLALLGTGFFGFMGWTFLVFLAYGLFFQYTKLEKNYFVWGIPAILILTEISLLVCDMIFRKKNKNKYHDFKDVRKVVLLRKQVSFRPGCLDFLVCETNEKGEMGYGQYLGFDGFDSGDAASMKPGQIIYKYTYGKDGVFLGTK